LPHCTGNGFVPGDVELKGMKNTGAQNESRKREKKGQKTQTGKCVVHGIENRDSVSSTALACLPDKSKQTQARAKKQTGESNT
jgi:hypothetical protein